MSRQLQKMPDVSPVDVVCLSAVTLGADRARPATEGVRTGIVGGPKRPEIAKGWRRGCRRLAIVGAQLFSGLARGVSARDCGLTVRRRARPDIAALVRAAVREALAEAMPRIREAIRDEVRAAFPAGRGPRDAADSALVGAIGDEVVGMPCFFASDVVALAGTSDHLREALRDADIETPDDLGTWLRRMRDIEVDGFVIRGHGRRVGRGQPWQCRKCG